MVPVPEPNFTEALGTLNIRDSGELDLRKAEAPVRIGALTGRLMVAPPRKGLAVGTGNASFGTDLVIVFGKVIDEEHSRESSGKAELTSVLATWKFILA